MTRRKPPKKTDSLEVRLPHAVKRAFMDRARRQGRTASALVRDFIESYLADADPVTKRRTMLKRLAPPAAVTSLVATAIALHMPTAASAAPDLKALFERLDRDRDGQLSSEEFAAHDRDALHSALQATDPGHMMSLMMLYHSGAAAPAHGPDAKKAAATLQAAFARQDGDGNGVVSFGEFESHHLGALRQAFDMIDADHGGGIDEREYGRVMAHLPVRIATHAKPFAEIDADGDGMIGWQEFLS